MQGIIKANDLKNDIVKEYYQQLIEAEKYREKEEAAAIMIQKTVKMHKEHQKHIIKLQAATKIKKVYKGHKARMKVEASREEESERRKMMFFESQATIIQKCFRGYMCRRYNHDYFARKQFLEHIMKKTKQVQEQMEEQSKMSNIEYQKSKEEMARAEFSMITGNLHHLLSTKIQAGVFNSPYAAAKPQAFNVDIETHLQTAFKSNYQWKPPANNRISFYKELAKEEFMIRKKLLQINKGINMGTHDPVATLVGKKKDPAKTATGLKSLTKIKLK